ncbi:hypothetical protein BLNAU_19875 [Blattamonas nauphoetae]|uniref:FPL domain-containing protein n=1 Tax=Blattamonas nauphoetae TaxID=2049346 RepID=A0ABQ9X078_9EUKA|nr:hypothetical protein BLNAU_19875 [Blattamonas nauphoetae]
MTDFLLQLRKKLVVFVCDSWSFFVSQTFSIADPNKSFFQTIILDDPSFLDIILNSLKHDHNDIGANMLNSITNIVLHFLSMKEKFMASNLVGRMLETVDFVSLPLSESKTLFYLTKFIVCMFDPFGNDEEARLSRYPLIRVSVFEPAKQFITFIFHNSEKLILNEELKSLLDRHLCEFHLSLKHLDLQSDEHNSELVSGIVKWNARWTIKMGKDDPFRPVFESILTRACEWRRNKAEQQKRREIDWDLIPDLIEFVMDNMKSSLSSLSPPDSLIHPLPRQTLVISPHAHLELVDHTQESKSLNELREGWIDDVKNGWIFFLKLIHLFPSTHQPTFQTIVLDDPSFSNVVLNSLTLNNTRVTPQVLSTMTQILLEFPTTRHSFRSEFFERIVKSVDFVNCPLSESETHLYLTQFIVLMLESTDDEEFMEHYRVIRVSIFEPAKQYVSFIFQNWDRLTLDHPVDRSNHGKAVCLIHCHIKNMEIKSDEHEPALVSILVKWEVRQMIELENEDHVRTVFESIGSRTEDWQTNKQDRQKRREELLREEGWDDAFELRVVGIEKTTPEKLL